MVELPRADKPQHPRPDHATWRPVLNAAYDAVPAGGDVELEVLLAGLLATQLQGAVPRDRSTVDKLYDIWADVIAGKIEQTLTMLSVVMDGDSGDPADRAEMQQLHLKTAQAIKERMEAALEYGA